MHRYESQVLKVLGGKNGISLEELVPISGLGRDEVMWALENLKKKGFVEIDYGSLERLSLTKEGSDYAKYGLPEERMIAELGKRQIKVSDLKEGVERIGLQWAKKNGLVTIEAGMVKLTEKGSRAVSSGLNDGKILRSIADSSYKFKSREEVADLIKRSLVELQVQRVITKISISQAGRTAGKESGEEGIDTVDRSVITSESWKSRPFKKYDVNVPVERRIPAMRHPLKKLINELKDAYVSMGFQEISGPAVESSFWTFDALFVPQDHPARDAQDTFYVDNVASAKIEDLPHVRTVRKAHEAAWHTKWSEDVAGQMLLRTHTTSVSSRFLYQIMEEIGRNPEKYQLPIKLFSIGRVFRNEAIDYRHLADFYQHDGLIIGKDLTLSNLFDALTRIYNRLGIKIKFKPSYFPFVEPGVEFMAYHESKKEWIELGGAGMIREEIVGVKRSKLTVLAWGPGLDRTLLIRDPSISSIVQLYNNDLGWIRNRKG